MKYQFQLNGQQFGVKTFSNLVEALVYLQELLTQAEIRELRTQKSTPTTKLAAQKRLRQNIIENLKVVQISDDKTTEEVFSVGTNQKNGLIRLGPPKMGSSHRNYVDVPDLEQPDDDVA